MMDKTALRILVVDDEPFMLKLHTRMLANLGYPSVTTNEGALSALESIDLASAPPDVILLDLNMPDMDGLEFLRYLVKRNYAGSVILVSGEDERVMQAAEKLVHAHRITSLGHVQKPVKPDLLEALLDRWKPAQNSGHGTPQGQDKSAAVRTFTADEVRSAIDNKEMLNHYQPKVSLITGHVVGVETLVRWPHALHGMVYPDQFIGVAEAHGLIGALTRFVIAGALRDFKSWQRETGLALHVAVNVSMDDLGSLDFVDYMAGATLAAGVLPNEVVLEVTESRLMSDLRVPLEVLTRLRLKRFRISIDDFGTGHSSLAQLRDIPFDELKIDRSFVHRAWGDETVRAIFDTSVILAKQLSMEIVTEGVEDRADWDFVRRSGSDVAQGYFIARPMPRALLSDWIVDWEERALHAA
jgi:EAL domain-containing protein (putative c-di-GMP-specific phosphodiesterase class I)/FixJ family two-component response regulator